MARDGAIPFSSFFEKLNTTSKTPINTLYLIFGSQVFFMGLYCVSLDAYYAIGGISTVGYLVAYVLTQLAYVTNKEIDFS